jgi:hypothetical protein
LNLRPLGYEPAGSFCVSPVSVCPAASCAQFRAQIWFLTCRLLSVAMRKSPCVAKLRSPLMAS